MSILTQFDAFLAADTAASRAFRAVTANFTKMIPDATGTLLPVITPHALFGGAVRDIDNNGASANPRDFDIVVKTQLKDLRDTLQEFGENRKTNAFNGFNFMYEGIRFDVWALRETLAIRKSGNNNPTFADLMPTTFFNLEAVALEVFGNPVPLPTPPAPPEPGQPIGTPTLNYPGPLPNPPRTTHDGGYNQAKTSGVLELNNPNTPFAVLQMVRAAGFVKRLTMTLGPNLEDWILANKIIALSDEGLTVTQTRYYGEGNEPCTLGEMRTTLDAAIAAAEARL